jgi:hypothetical protein
MLMISNTTRFMALFSGYTKAYGTYNARMLGGSGKQKPKQWKVDRPTTADTFKNHLNGQQPLGIYLLNDNEMVRFAAIDIDLYPFDHTKLSKQLDEWGLPFVVCNSKSGGAHVYVFFREPEDPARVIAELRKVSEALGYPDAEVFPKQIKRPPGDYGNYINLPFFDHPKLSYNCWDGGQQLGLDGFLDLAESRLTNLAAFSAAIAKAGLEPRGMSEPPVNGHTIAGRNDFLFRFGCSVRDAVEDEAALLKMLQQKNRRATVSDHLNFGTEGPLPTNEVEQLCKSVVAQKQKERKNDVKQVIEELNMCHAHVMVGSKARILHIKSDPDHGWNIHEFYQQADFKSHYANRKVRVGKQLKTVGELWLSHPERRSYEGVTFNPNGASEGYYNLFQGFPVEPARGDCGLYLDHIQNNICKGDEDLYEYVINWMADAIQNPGRRPGVALVIRGKQGVGKGVFVNEFRRLFGPHGIQVTQSSHLVGNFNAHLRDKLLVFADEAFWAGDKRAEGQLKAMVTEENNIVEMKGVDARDAPNFARLIMASNNDWVVPASVDQRRFVVMEAGNARMQDSSYFKALRDQMEQGGRQALMQFLLDRDLSGVELRRIPRTDALAEQQLRSLDSVGQWLYAALDAGGFEEQGAGGVADFRPWPEFLQITEVHACYLFYCKRHSYPRPVLSSALGKRLNELLPSIEKRRISIGKGRKNAYLFTSLDNARDEFVKVNRLTSIRWAEDEALRLQQVS